MSADLSFDGRYLRSISAVCKVSCLAHHYKMSTRHLRVPTLTELCTFIGFLCILCSSTVRPHNLRGAFYLAVAAIAFCCSSCSLLAGLVQFWQRNFHNFNAARYEMFLNGFLACIVFVAAAVSCSMDVLEYSLATFFGFFAACFYAYEAYLGICLSRKCSVATQTQIA